MRPLLAASKGLASTLFNNIPLGPSSWVRLRGRATTSYGAKMSEANGRRGGGGGAAARSSSSTSKKSGKDMVVHTPGCWAGESFFVANTVQGGGLTSSSKGRWLVDEEQAREGGSSSIVFETEI